MTPSTAVEWREFGAEAFELARRDRKPVLLLLSPPWCARRSWAEAEGLLRKFVAVRADPVRRPDVAARYGDGAWPSAAVLSPWGDVIASAATPSGSGLAALLERALGAYLKDPDGLERELETKRFEAVQREAMFELQERLDAGLARTALEALGAEFDPGHGGFGGGPKTASPDALDFLLYAAREWKDEAALRMLHATLRAIDEGGLRDREEGGFFRQCASSDWREPSPEKVLGSNARIARVLLDAFLFTKEPAYRQAAEEALGWMKLALYDSETGGFAASSHAPAEYWALPKSGRLESEPPTVDGTFFVDQNAMVVPMLLKAACVFRDRREELEQMTVRLLGLLETRFFDHHDGMFHYAEPGEAPKLAGLLGDQAWTMIAFTEAFQYFMEREYRDFADELLRLTLRNQWYREKAGFHDRPAEEALPGLLAVPHLPIDLNAVALEAIWRLSELKGVPNYARWLEMGFMNLWPRIVSRPREAAAYARLHDTYLKGRLELDLIGHPEDPKTRELLTRLKSHYLPRALVSFIDPDDMDFILAHRLTAPRYPRLFVIANGRPVASGDRPEEIDEALQAV